MTSDRSGYATVEPRVAVCHSCRSERPVAEMRHPVSFSFEVLTDRWECNDADACWLAFRTGERGEAEWLLVLAFLSLWAAVLLWNVSNR